MATTNKINWLLILQGWAMLWVVIGHSGPCNSVDDYPSYAFEIWTVAYSFHMDLLMFVSGWLFYWTRMRDEVVEKWPYGKIIADKLKHLGIPFVVFTLITMVIKVVFASEVERASSLSIGEFLNAIIYPYNGPARELWFIGTLMWMFVLVWLWKISLKNKVTVAGTILTLIALKYFGVETEFLSLGRVCRFAIFFYLGIIVCKEGIIEQLIIHKNAPIALLLAGAVIYVLGRYFHEGFLVAIGGIIASLALALILDNHLPKTFFTFRNYTMQIYLIGIFAQMAVKMVRLHGGYPFSLFYVISLIAGLYVPVIIAKLLERINWEPLLLCVGMKKKK